MLTRKSRTKPDNIKMKIRITLDHLGHLGPVMKNSEFLMKFHVFSTKNDHFSHKITKKLVQGLVQGCFDLGPTQRSSKINKNITTPEITHSHKKKITSFSCLDIVINYLKIFLH